MPIKSCKVCKQEQDISKFPKNSNGKYGVGHMCLVCHADYSRNYKAKNYNYYYALKYKTSEEVIERLLSRRVCDICGAEPKPTKRNSIDHCHNGNSIRGLLCDDCNIALGKFKDRVELLQKAIDYLNNTEVIPMDVDK